MLDAGDVSQRIQDLWSQLEDDRDILPRALQKHFPKAPEVLENLIAEMVTHTPWPVDKHNVVENESEAKKEPAGECKSAIVVFALFFVVVFFCLFVRWFR